MMFKNKKKRILFPLIAIMMFAVVPSTYGMHIMEGFLPPQYCIAWGVVSLPFLFLGVISIQKQLKANRRNITLLAMSGAFIFVISSLKIPSVTGSCSHMTGTGLGAILFGVAPVSVLGLIVLLFQAILLAHGGLTTLGANVFSMAIAGPLVTWGIYKLGKMLGLPKRVNVFLAAFLGDLGTYCITALQLAISYPSAEGGVSASLTKFLGIFAVTQIPLAVIEGILTVMIMIFLESYAKDELKWIQTKEIRG